jgi:hypothetical protein
VPLTVTESEGREDQECRQALAFRAALRPAIPINPVPFSSFRNLPPRWGSGLRKSCTPMAYGVCQKFIPGNP